MFKYLFYVSLLLISSSALADKVVAVIDTGIDPNSANLCAGGHRDFTDTFLKDTAGHGTHVAGLISKNAGKSKFCMLNLKFYSPEMSKSISPSSAMKSAIKYAILLKVDIINISAGGVQSDAEEAFLLKLAIDRGIKVVVAAGNEGTNLNDKCNYFPACYNNGLIIVGNLTQQKTRAISSNYGDIVNRWEVGSDVESNLPNGKVGKMTGTSQATAVATGKILSNLN